MKNLKRLLSLLPCLVMVAGLAPTTAFALDDGTKVSEVSVTINEPEVGKSTSTSITTGSDTGVVESLSRRRCCLLRQYL